LPGRECLAYVEYGSPDFSGVWLILENHTG
jgi:hypothetical protein